MQVKAGSYTGNGTVDRAVTGVGFQPDLVIVKRANTGDTAFFRTTSMATGSSMTLRADNGIVTGGIKTFNSDGFTLGTNGEVNANTVTYYYLAVKKDSAGDFDYGTYTGNGSDNRNLTLQSTFPFTWLVIKGDGGRTGAYRNKDVSGDNTHAFYFNGYNTDQIQSMSTSTGDVQLGTSDFVNANSRTYYWFGFKEVAGFSTSFTYTGNGSDNRDISIPGTTFQPGFVWLKRQDTSDPRMRTSGHSGDSSQSFDGATETNSIQGFNATGFQVGTNSQVNNNTSTYHVLALKEGISATSNATPSALSAALAVLAPVVVGAAAIAASVLTGTTAVQSATARGAANVSPAVLTRTLTVQSPTLSGQAQVSPNALTGTFAIQTPSPDGGGTNVLPNALTGAIEVQAPTVTGGASVSPSAVNLTGQVQAPTPQGAASVPPAVNSVAFSILVPTVTGAANISPAAVSATLSIQSPTVSTPTIVSPSVITGTFTVQSPQIRAGAVITPSTVTLTASVRTPSVRGQLWTPLPKPDAITWTPASRPTTTWTPSSRPATSWTPLNKPQS